MQDAYQLVRISKTMIGWQVRNKVELKVQEEGHILEMTARLNQDS